MMTAVSVSVIVSMIVIGGVIMAVSVPVAMFVLVSMAAMLMVVYGVGRLGQGVVFFEGGVVAMLVAAAVGAGLGLERRFDQLDGYAFHLLQHVQENRVVLQLQISLADFQRHMPVAKMVGGSRQLRRGAGCYSQDGLRSGLDDDEFPVVGQEKVAVGQDRALQKGKADFLAVVQGKLLPAAAPQFERQDGPGGVAGQRHRNVDAMQVFFDDAHDQKRK